MSGRYLAFDVDLSSAHFYHLQHCCAYRLSILSSTQRFIMKSLPGTTVDKARVLLRQGKTSREVSRELGISVSSALRIRKRDLENIPPSRAGRHMKVSGAARRQLARQYETGKLVTLREGRQELESTEGVQLHTRTVWNYLSSQGLKGYVQPKKNDLTKEQMAARHQFAKDHLNWTVEDWKRVMFSDETIVSRVGSFGRKYYYQRPESRRPGRIKIKPTKQSGGGKMMIWGCVTYYGVGDSCWFPGSMNSEGYIEVLQDYVLQSRDWYSMDPATFLFQHDNSSVHTSKAVRTYLERAGIAVLKWPVNSPDLSPIERLWAELKRRLDRYQEPPKNMKELWERFQKEWLGIPTEFIQKLYNDLPRKMRLLKRYKGAAL